MSTGVKVTAEGSGKSLPTNLAGVAGVPGTGDNVDWEDGGGAPGSIPGSGNFETKNEGGNPTVKAHGACGAAETIDPTDGNVHTLTLDANCTFTLNVPAGTSATLELWITQDGTGGWAITWPVSVTVVGTLDTTLSTTSIVVLTTVNTGTSWVAVVVGSGGSSLTVKDEGTPLATAATSIDFVGAGVTASGAGAAKTITIPGGSIYFNVKDDYGAVGDNTTNDTAAIQAALDAAGAVGGTVYFPAGTYKITAQLDIDVSTITLLGDNPWTSIIRQATANTSGLVFTNAGSLSLIEKLQVKGPTGNSSGIGIDTNGSSDYIQMRSVRTDGFFIGVRHGAGTFYGRLFDCWIYRADSIGVQCLSGSNNTVVTDTYVSTCPVGIDIAGAESTKVIGGSVESCTTAAIRINGGTNAAGAYIAAVYFEQDDGVPDILIGNSTVAYGTTIIGNTHVKSSYSGTGWAVDAPFATGLTIIGEHIDSSDAIRVNSSSGPAVVMNLRRRNAGTVTLPSGSINIDTTSATPTVALGTAASTGTGTSLLRADATIVAFDATSPATQAIGDSAVVGVAAVAARRDHKHAMPSFGSPVATGALNADGSAVTVARSDHVHQSTATSNSEHAHVVDCLVSGDGSTTAFLLPVAPFDQYSVTAFVSGVLTEVTLSGALFDIATFGSAPAAATNNIRFDIVAATV